MKQRDLLQVVAWAEKYFGSLHTTRQVPRRDMMRAVKNGYAKSIGMAVACDGDGFVAYPERYREGFVLTDLGRRALNGDTK